MSTNICKECGKEFEASSPRIKYCTDIHYRPCPICGDPVIAKYLSDPARRCEKCKSAPSPKPAAAKPVATPTKFPKIIKPVSMATMAANNSVEPARVHDVSAFEDIREYIGKPLCGFQTGHVYALDIEQTWSGYNVTATRDDSEDGKTVDYMMPFASQISIDRYFRRLK